MNSQDILNDITYKYSEYIEMQSNPDAFISDILAKKIVSLNEYIEYLERRVRHVTDSK